ncbi:alanine dehydrogenase [Aeromonas hydrophila]|uniref:alanine dehydrogenase n=1 Tax=Aeromonas hydrophila TaxID=644 RepID=UPI0022AEC746|nr:alanine dehydrogenase [Aeromonas hydrophila]ELB2789870.1 alanine dehydrogenase [Aeromonas hydrophila]MCZ4331261.1 alanine dehydrogenase [Aeromonas hydrophila]MDE8810265.1 alanine dehydrogenase [Aeromonas hydrophila]
MIIGVPKEIKNHEYRVGMAVASVRELTARNHTVFAQSGAGSGIDSGGADYRAATVAILSCIAAIFTATGVSIRLKT